MIKKVSLLVAGCIIFNLAAAQSYRISANITGFKNGTKILLKTDQGAVLNDTQFSKNTFDMAGSLKNGPQYLTVVIHNGSKEIEFTLFAKDDIIIKGDKKDIPYNLRISGSAEQAAYNQYQHSLNALNIKSDNLMKAYQKVQADSIAARKAAIAYNIVGGQIHTATKKWISGHTNTYISANLLYNYLSELSKNTVTKYYNSFSPAIKQSIYGRRLKTYLNIGDTLKIGDKAYNFEAYTVQGTKQSLNAFKGKFVLIDFSSIHCEHCEDSQNELRRLSAKYKNQLTVLSLTPDNHTDWIKGIKEGNVTWISLNDGEGSYSQTLLKYNVQAYPSFYLISPNGLIADKWLGYEVLTPGEGDIERHLIKHLRK